MGFLPSLSPCCSSVLFFISSLLPYSHLCVPHLLAFAFLRPLVLQPLPSDSYQATFSLCLLNLTPITFRLSDSFPFSDSYLSPFLQVFA